MNKHYVTVTSQIRCLHAHVRLQADLLRSTWPTSTHFGSGVLFFAIGNYFGLSLGDRNENVTRIDLKLRFHCKCIGMTVLHWAGATCYCSIWSVCWYVWHSSPGFCTFRPCFSIYAAGLSTAASRAFALNQAWGEYQTKVLCTSNAWQGSHRYLIIQLHDFSMTLNCFHDFSAANVKKFGEFLCFAFSCQISVDLPVHTGSIHWDLE